jgi:omega-6 fatty acid desaturase (delta-12 desaturase)
LFQALRVQVIALHVRLRLHLLTRRLATDASLSVFDVVVIAGIFKATKFVEPFIAPEHLSLPHPALYTAAWLSLWALYTFFVGLFATGLWVIAHECGHQAFSESKTVNNAVGWVLHSAYVQTMFQHSCQ